MLLRVVDHRRLKASNAASVIAISAETNKAAISGDVWSAPFDFSGPINCAAQKFVIAIDVVPDQSPTWRIACLEGGGGRWK